MAAGLIVLAAVAVYHNSFAGTFVYDDDEAIVGNRTIRRLWPIWEPLSPPSNGETVSGRPLLNLSLALNYALGGLEVRGYHVTNLLIHTVAALLLMGILRQTFLLPALRNRFGKAATALALASALMWTVHPLQTESVTYIAQRAESLAGLFYLLTLYCLIRGARKEGVGNLLSGSPATSPRVPGTLPGRLPGPAQIVWYVAAVVACSLGMACKEVVVTAPLVVLLYDRTFLSGSFKEAWRRRWALYLGLAATWALLTYLVIATGLVGCQTAMGAPDTWSYARTQPGIILHYLRLAVWPRPLCLDYVWPVANGFWEIVPAMMVVGVLVATTVRGLIGRKHWAFLGAWFLLILAPTSSVFRLAELAFEHRTYLPLAAVIVLAITGGYALWERLLPRLSASGRSVAPVRWAAPLIALSIAIVALGCATIRRNWDYRSALDFWQDALAKHPHSFFVHYALGNALASLGSSDEAINRFHEALALKPDYAKAHNNLGLALANLGRTDEAMRCYREALRLEPGNAGVHNNLGMLLADLGKTDEAIPYYHEALRLKPDYADAHNNLGNALAAQGKLSEATAQYEEALRLQPDYAKAPYNLGNLLGSMGRTDEAIERYHQALRLKPNFAEAHNNLGTALVKLSRTEEAIAQYRQALRLKPDYLVARSNLANVLAGIGNTKEAIEHYNRLLERAPDSVEALKALAWVLATREPTQGGDPARAVRLAERARELSRQEDTHCLDVLAAAYAAVGRFGDAIAAAEQALRLAESTGQTALAQNIRLRLERYRAGQPYREGAR